MVRLLLEIIENVAVTVQRFNPTMVRLLLIVESSCRLDTPVFQSHNGAIAAIK